MLSAATADALWAQVEPQVFITREQFFAGLDGWDVNEIAVGGKPAFVTARRGPLFHFHSLDTGARISLRMIREFLAPIITDHGFAQTMTPKSDTRQQRFNRKLGFAVVGEDEFHMIFRINPTDNTRCL